MKIQKALARVAKTLSFHTMFCIPFQIFKGDDFLGEPVAMKAPPSEKPPPPPLTPETPKKEMWQQQKIIVDDDDIDEQVPTL